MGDDIQWDIFIDYCYSYNQYYLQFNWLSSRGNGESNWTFDGRLWPILGNHQLA